MFIVCNVYFCEMKKWLYELWYNAMRWESYRLRRKTNRLASKLAKSCEQQSAHNDKLAAFEMIVNKLLSISDIKED